MFGAFLMINASCLSQLEQCCIAEGEWYSFTVENMQEIIHPSRQILFGEKQQNRCLCENAFLNPRSVWNLRWGADSF